MSNLAKLDNKLLTLNTRLLRVASFNYAAFPKLKKMDTFYPTFSKQQKFIGSIQPKKLVSFTDSANFIKLENEASNIVFYQWNEENFNKMFQKWNNNHIINFSFQKPSDTNNSFLYDALQLDLQTNNENCFMLTDKLQKVDERVYDQLQDYYQSKALSNKNEDATIVILDKLSSVFEELAKQQNLEIIPKPVFPNNYAKPDYCVIDTDLYTQALENGKNEELALWEASKIIWEVKYGGKLHYVDDFHDTFNAIKKGTTGEKWALPLNQLISYMLWSGAPVGILESLRTRFFVVRISEHEFIITDKIDMTENSYASFTDYIFSYGFIMHLAKVLPKYPALTREEVWKNFSKEKPEQKKTKSRRKKVNSSNKDDEKYNDDDDDDDDDNDNNDNDINTVNKDNLNTNQSNQASQHNQGKQTGSKQGNESGANQDKQTKQSNHKGDNDNHNTAHNNNADGSSITVLTKIRYNPLDNEGIDGRGCIGVTVGTIGEDYDTKYAFKYYNVNDEKQFILFENESNAYQRLAEHNLCGTIVPSFQLLEKVNAENFKCIATPIIGKKDFEMLLIEKLISLKEFDEYYSKICIEIINSIHQCGIIHNDIDFRHFIFDEHDKKHKLKLIDFSHSKIFDNLNDKHFVELKNKEKKALNDYLKAAREILGRSERI